MRRLFGLALLAIVSCAGSGCAMCESCFDYNYPAYGGSGRYQTECHCRAGSAFCGHGYAAYEMVDGVETAPSEATPAEGTPPPAPGTPSTTTPRPPVDLGPPRTEETDDDPLELPQLPDTPSSTQPGDDLLPPEELQPPSLSPFGRSGAR